MIKWDVNAIGIDAFESYVNSFPQASRKAALLSVNDGARKGRTLAKREIMKQVALPSSYLGDASKGRLRISRWASKNKLQAVITGRGEATSLLRFAINQGSLHAKGTHDSIVAGRGSVKLRVKPGSTSAIDNAYILRLKNGNYGLAIRPGKGGVRGRYKQKRLGSRWALLYGPSVDQVFRDVRVDIAPEVHHYLTSEFDRQFYRLTKK